MFIKHPWAPFEAAFQQWIEQVDVRPFWDKAKRDSALEFFYPAVVKAAAGIVSSPSFRWLRLSGGDVAHEWLADMESRGFPGYDRSRPFYPYGHKLLVRKCQGIRKREKYRRVRNPKYERIARGKTPGQQAATNELVGQLRNAFSVLTQEEREIVYRKYFLRESSRTIGAALGMTAAKVNARLHRIRLNLRRVMNGGGEQGAA